MLGNFIQETANAPGSATTINLAGPPTGRRGFLAVFASGASVYYFMDDGTQAEWGIGTVTSGTPNTLARTTVIGTSAGTTTRLNFTGTTRVYNEVPAERLLFVDSASVIQGATAAQLRARWEQEAEVDVASATTTDIGAAASRKVRITGTTTITSLGTVAAGTERLLRFAASLTLTHSATSLILPGGVNVVTQAGDTATAVSLGGGNWVVRSYQRAGALGIALGTHVAGVSGSSIDFLNIPVGVRRITAMYSNLSTSAATNPVVRVGTSGGVVTTGYEGSQSLIDGTTVNSGLLSANSGFSLGGANAASLRNGRVTLTRIAGNLWAADILTGLGNTAAVGVGAGSVALSAELDRVRFTTGSADTFDAGTINISWEY